MPHQPVGEAEKEGNKYCTFTTVKAPYCGTYKIETGKEKPSRCFINGKKGWTHIHATIKENGMVRKSQCVPSHSPIKVCMIEDLYP